MLLTKGLGAAVLLLSGVQAGVAPVRLEARAVDANVTTTPGSATYTNTPISLPSSDSITTPGSSTTETDATTPGSSATETDATDVSSTATDVSTATDGPTTIDVSTATDGPTTTDVSTATNGPTTTDALTSTIADGPTTSEATLPTGTITGTGTSTGLPAAATDAASSFSDLVSAVSSIAAKPSISVEDVENFQEQAEDEYDELERIEAELKAIDPDSLSEDDSHIVEEALLGLGALLTWFSINLTALSSAVTAPALAATVFADIAPAFAAVITGTLLSDALSGLENLGNDNDGGDDGDDGDDNDDDDDDDDDDEPTTTEESAVSSTAEATSTTTTSGAFCSAIPYELDLHSSDDDDNSTDEDLWGRSVDSLVELEDRGHLEKRARFPYFGNCKKNKAPAFPANPSAKQLSAAEDKPNKQNQDWRDIILRWYDRKDCVSEDDMTPGWKIADNAEAKVKGAAAGGMHEYWTVDHIWELKFFTDFFEIELLPGPRSKGHKLTCDEFDDIFMTKYDKCGKPSTDAKLKTLMQQLVEKAPSSAPKSTQLEFVAMNKQINEIKGAMFKLGELKEKGFTDNFSKSTLQTIQTLEAIGNAVDIFNSGPVKALFEVTNQRMYNSFKGVEQFITDKGLPMSLGDVKFADNYEEFMTKRLDTNAQDAWQFVDKWTDKVRLDIAQIPDEDENKKTLSDLFNGFEKSKYASKSHYSFSANRDLAGAGGAAVVFKRSLWERAEGDEGDEGDSCTIETTTGEATSTVAQPTTIGESTAVSTTEESSTVTPTEQSTIASNTAESTAVSSTEESTAVSSTEEPTAVSSTEQSTAFSTTEESTAVSTTEESTAFPTTEESTIVTPTEESTAFSSTEDVSTFSTTEESTAPSSTEEPTSTIESSVSSVEPTSFVYTTVTTFLTSFITESTSEEPSSTIISTSSVPSAIPTVSPNPDGTNVVSHIPSMIETRAQLTTTI